MKTSTRLPPKEPNIYRYTHNGATSWVVQVKRAGEKWVEYFADGDDGPWASQRKAKAWRDNLKKRIAPLNKLHRRSLLGPKAIAGAFPQYDRTRAGTLIRRWAAIWPKPGGSNAKRTFSVPKYGERRAKALALEARQQGVAELLAARARMGR